MSDALTLEQDELGPVSLRDDGGKRRQVLDGAREVFLADGFDGASMNDIARKAGVSKGTLYVYFNSKEELFAALIRDEKRAQAEQMCHSLPADGDPRQTLAALGVRLMETMFQPSSIAHLRTVVGVAAKFPAVGRAFYEAGPEFGMRKVSAYLDTQVAAGRLDIRNTEMAAVLLIDMFKSFHYLRAILCVGQAPKSADIEAHVAEAVDIFLRAYAPGRSSRAS